MSPSSDPAAARFLRLRGGTADLTRRVFEKAGETRPLTGKEAELLGWLAARPRTPVTREQLLVELWGYSTGMVTRTVDVTIRRLRTKIEEDPARPDHILTLHGEGYVFEPFSDPSPSLEAVPPHDRPAKPPAAGGALVATEIEDAERRWASCPEAMTAALAIHDHILRETALAAGAQDVHTLGDNTRTAFEDAATAVRWCLAARAALAAAVWPEPVGEVRIRMGVYVGSSRRSLHASRLAAAGHGGQVLVAGIDADSLAEDGFVLHLLGQHRLPDVPESESVWEACNMGPARVFPPLRALPVHRTNITEDPGPLFGREADLAAVRALLVDNVLVTLIGPGGMGKTRLARRIAREAVDRMSGGAWFVDLSAARTRDDAISAIATVLGVPLGGAVGEAAVQRLVQAVSARGPILLVLDNFEQLIDAAGGLMAAWAQPGRLSRVLVTSREALGVREERRHALPPLLSQPGAALFVERAREVHPGFDPGPAEQEAIVELVRRLDGSPLALALAAARTGVLSPREILGRLDQPFRMLRGARAAKGDRHASLHAVLEWSWALLSDAEQAALAQCSVFRAPFTLEAAEEVLKPPNGAWTDELVEALCEKSLIRAASGDGGPARLSLYETVRAFAAEQLDGAALKSVEDRHAAYFLRVGEAHAASLDGPGGLEARQAMHRILPELIAVHSRWREDRPIEAIRAVLALAPVLTALGPAERVVALLDDAIHLSESWGGDLRARALLARGMAREFMAPGASQRDFEAAREVAFGIGRAAIDAEAEAGLGRLLARGGEAEAGVARLVRARSLIVSFGSGPRLARVDGDLAHAHFLAGDVPDALLAAERALQGARACSDRQEEAQALGMRGMVHGHLLRLPEAQADFEAAIELHRRLGDRLALAMDYANVGYIHAEAHRDDEAREAYRTALELNRAVGSRRGEGVVLGNLGWTELGAGNLPEAMARCAEAVVIHREQGNRGDLGNELGALGACELVLGKYEAGFGHLEEAIRVLEGIREVRLVALRQVMLGLFAVWGGDAPNVVRHLGEARATLQGGEAPTLATAMDVLDGFIDLVHGRVEDARARLSLGGERPPLDVRVASVMLRSALPR